MAEDPMVPRYKKILAPFDGSAGSLKALRRAVQLGMDHGSDVTALSVDEHTPRFAPGVGEVEEEPELRSAHYAELRARVSELGREQGVAIKAETIVGHAAQSIVSRAGDGGFDLVVIGHSGHSGGWGSLLGSTTARVVDQSPCDVLVVRSV